MKEDPINRHQKAHHRNRIQDERIAHEGDCFMNTEKFHDVPLLLLIVLGRTVFAVWVPSLANANMRELFHATVNKVNQRA